MMKLTVVCLFVTICVIAAQECKEGETKTEECNNCRCANGIWACTKRYCVRGKREALEANNEVAREKREVPGADVLAITPCAPNDYFQLDCNVCYCKTDRTGYLCTDNNCSDEAWDLSTTTHIPLSNDSMLIMSNYGVELIENLNSNDNSISRIAKSVKSQTLSHETVDPEIVNIDPKSAHSQIVDDVTVESEDESETSKSETVKDEPVETETVQDEPVETETVQDEPVTDKPVYTQTVTNEPVDTQTVTNEPVDTQTDKNEPVEPATVENEPAETGTVKSEPGASAPVEASTVKGPVASQSVDSDLKPARKNSPRNPLILANEQRRLTSLRNQ